MRGLDVPRSLKDQQQRRQESPGCSCETEKVWLMSRGPPHLQRSQCLGKFIAREATWTRPGEGEPDVIWRDEEDRRLRSSVWRAEA